MGKIIGIMGVLSAIVVIVTSVLYLVKRIMIPGLSPIALSLVMVSLMYTTKISYDQGKVPKSNWRVILAMTALAIVMNIIAGVSQFLSVMN
jgi:hypothetical protein